LGPFERLVCIVDVGLVVLVVVEPHRLLVDVRLERVVVVRKRWYFERHGFLLSTAETLIGQRERTTCQSMLILATCGFAQLELCRLGYSSAKQTDVLPRPVSRRARAESGEPPVSGRHSLKVK